MRFLLEWCHPNREAFLDKHPKATQDEIQQALSGVLCRCFTHVRMYRAVQKYAKEMAQ